MIELPHQSAVTLAGAIHETAMTRYRAELTATPGCRLFGHRWSDWQASYGPLGFWWFCLCLRCGAMRSI